MGPWRTLALRKWRNGDGKGAANRKSSSLESADLNALRRLSQASIARKLGVNASALCKYLKKHPLEHEGEGVEGEGVEGEGGEKPWGSLEDEYLQKLLANKDGPRTSSDVNWITDQLPGRDADAVRRRMRELEKEAEAAAEEAARRAATALRTEAARRAEREVARRGCSL